LRVDTEMEGEEEGGWASSRRSESMLSDGGGDAFAGERLRILIERP